jgi:hypothetical protein
MKVSSVFALITSSTDLLDLFEGIETTDQLVSRLDRLKRQGSDILLDCLYALKGSTASLLDDTLEMSATLVDPEDDDELSGDLTDAELESLTIEEKQSPSDPPPPEVEKT